MHNAPTRPALILIVLALGVLGCTPAPPAPTAAPTLTPVPTATPVPTWTPTPVPTPTPIPPAELTILWPDEVSPLTPVPIEVDVVPPPGIEALARVDATVMDPEANVYATFDLTRADRDRYRSLTLLQLPLEPLSGYWWLIVHAESELPIVGLPVVYFEIAPVVFRDLSATLPSGVIMRVPEGFREVVAQGDATAGGRVWAHGGGEVGLWWAPGPTEDLLLSNALVMLEATYDADTRDDTVPVLTEALPIEWQARPGYEFPESWLAPASGTGRAWVIQGPDSWLYVLRVRGIGTDDIPPLIDEVAQTFSFVEATE